MGKKCNQCYGTMGGSADPVVLRVHGALCYCKSCKKKLPPLPVSMQRGMVILLSSSSWHGLQHLYPDMDRGILSPVGVEVFFRVDRDDIVDQIDRGGFGVAADLSRAGGVDPHGKSNGPFNCCAHGVKDDERLSVLDEELFGTCKLALVTGGCCYVDVCWEGLWSQWCPFPERGYVVIDYRDFYKKAIRLGGVDRRTPQHEP